MMIHTGIDVKYLTSSAVTELAPIDDIGRKVLHLRRMILRTQASLKSVDKVMRMKDLRSAISAFGSH